MYHQALLLSLLAASAAASAIAPSASATATDYAPIGGIPTLQNLVQTVTVTATATTTSTVTQPCNAAATLAGQPDGYMYEICEATGQLQQEVCNGIRGGTMHFNNVVVMPQTVMLTQAGQNNGVLTWGDPTGTTVCARIYRQNSPATSLEAVYSFFQRLPFPGNGPPSCANYVGGTETVGKSPLLPGAQLPQLGVVNGLLELIRSRSW